MPNLAHPASRQTLLYTTLRNTNYSLTRTTELANFRQEHSYVHDVTTLHWPVLQSVLLAQQIHTKITKKTVKQNIASALPLAHGGGGPTSSMSQQPKMLFLEIPRQKCTFLTYVILDHRSRG